MELKGYMNSIIEGFCSVYIKVFHRILSDTFLYNIGESIAIFTLMAMGFVLVIVVAVGVYGKIR